MGRPYLLLSTTGSASNIGDYGHTPSALRVLQREAPSGATVTVWPKRPFNDRELSFLRAAFPDFDHVDGELGPDGVPSTEELRAAMERAEVLVHGSGPSLLRAGEVAGWQTYTGRPYGFFGVTSDPLLPSGGMTLADGTPYESGGTLAELADHVAEFASVDRLSGVQRQVAHGASFLYCRDSLSEEYLCGQGCEAEFSPDAFFGFDWADSSYADRLWASAGLDDRPVVAVVPRVRHAPYGRNNPNGPSAEDRRRLAESEANEDNDLGPVVALIVSLVRDRDLQVLLCPEMGHEVETAKEVVLPRLPEDVRASVKVVDDRWLPHEAFAVFGRCVAMVSMHCHSPFLAVVQGIPMVYHRLPTETVKGQMWHDIGLGDRVVESAWPDAAERLHDTVWSLLDQAEAERDRLATVRDTVRAQLAERARQVWDVAAAVQR